MWASGNYPTMVETFLTPLGPRLVEACRIGAGVSVLDVASGTGNAAIPAAQQGAHVTASDLTPELLQAGAAARAGRRRRARLGDRRRREPAVRGRVLRHRDVLDRRDVRAAPPGRGRRAGPRLPPRRHDRPAELDARGHARRALPHDGPVRPAAAPGRLARRRCGARRRTCASSSATASSGARSSATCSRSPPSSSRATTASTSRRTTARRSASAPTRTSRAARRSSTPRWTPSATTGTSARADAARFEKEFLVAVGTRA